jgi:hypothetical protein
VAGVLIGYVLVGLGCANIAPALFSLAGHQTRMPGALAITAVSTLGFAGILAGPALIGFAANHFGLIAAFIGVATALLLVAMSTRWLRVYPRISAACAAASSAIADSRSPSPWHTTRCRQRSAAATRQSGDLLAQHRRQVPAVQEVEQPAPHPLAMPHRQQRIAGGQVEIDARRLGITEVRHRHREAAYRCTVHGLGRADRSRHPALHHETLHRRIGHRRLLLQPRAGSCRATCSAHPLDTMRVSPCPSSNTANSSPPMRRHWISTGLEARAGHRQQRRGSPSAPSTATAPPR